MAQQFMCLATILWVQVWIPARTVGMHLTQPFNTDNLECFFFPPPQGVRANVPEMSTKAICSHDVCPQLYHQMLQARSCCTTNMKEVTQNVGNDYQNKIVWKIYLLVRLVRKNNIQTRWVHTIMVCLHHSTTGHWPQRGFLSYLFSATNF